MHAEVDAATAPSPRRPRTARRARRDSGEYARRRANEDEAWALGKLSCVGVAMSAGRSSSAGGGGDDALDRGVQQRRPPTTAAPARTSGTCARGRRSAPAAPSASHSAACSPSARERAARTTSSTGTWHSRRQEAVDADVGDRDAPPDRPDARRARQDRRAAGSATGGAASTRIARRLWAKLRAACSSLVANPGVRPGHGPHGARRRRCASGAPRSDAFDIDDSGRRRAAVRRDAGPRRRRRRRRLHRPGRGDRGRARRLPLAVVPTGTANDFARALRLPRRPEAALPPGRGPATRPREPLELRIAGERRSSTPPAAGLSVAAAAARAAAQGARSARSPTRRRRARGAHRAPAALSRSRRRRRGLRRRGVAGHGRRAPARSAAAAELAGADPGDGLLDVVVVARRLAAAPRPARLRACARGHARDQRGVLHPRVATRRSACAPGTEFNVDGEICALRARPLHACAPAACGRGGAA